ncbi:MAG: hypothetical protein GX758_03245, partial [Tenericutes bacterium]|nr:hypothetical protein [Mycoplasmatota bacterium]
MKLDSKKKLAERQAQIAYELQYEVLLKDWYERLGNMSAAKYVISKISTINDKKDMIDVYEFVIRVFKSRGFEKEEAINHMANNKYIFASDRQRIIDILGIVEIVNLGDKILFEDPRLLTSLYTLDEIYSGVKALQNKSENFSVDELMLYLNLKKSTNDGDVRKISEPRRISFSTFYLKRLEHKEA